MDLIKPNKIVFDREKGTLLVCIPDSFSIPASIEEYAKEKGFEIKEEFHITIFGFDSGKRILERIQKNNLNKEEVFSQIEKSIESKDWQCSLEDEWYQVSKTYQGRAEALNGGSEERQSIICMASVLGLEDFLSDVERAIGFSFSPPPLHVTAFSKSTHKENMGAGIGISSREDLRKLHPTPLRRFSLDTKVKYSKILIPTRPQPDTIISILILKRFGGMQFQGIETAFYEVLPQLPKGQTEEMLFNQGVFLLDLGGGIFDHHNKPFQTTVSALVARALGVEENPALQRLLQLAERDDFHGKGTISIDPLDRAFGLPGLIAVLNKDFVAHPEKVIEAILPLLEAFLHEEERRVFELPQELKDKTEQGKVNIFTVSQRREILKCIVIDTDNTSMAGFLRARAGGNFDVVAVRLSSGHVNILTRQAKKVDLQSLALLIRMQEAEAKGDPLQGEARDLVIPGIIKQVPEWYYDQATNSIFNGGPNPVGIPSTKIDPFELPKLLEIGLSEKLWSPEKKG